MSGAEREIARLREELSHLGRVALVNQLAPALAHEINQPLGAILRNAEAGEMILASANPDLDEVRAILADIRSDDRRASSVIDRVRAFIRRRDTERAPVSPRELLSDVTALMQADSQSRGITIQTKVIGHVPQVIGDRMQLQQVLLNLLLNAMDAMSEANSEGRHIELCVGVADGGAVEFTVTDDGPGLSAEQVASLSKPFVTTKANGLGLGLSISRTIIEDHGGQIWARNRTDPRGCTFGVRLPAAVMGGWP